MITTNYYNTFIQVAEDCPIDVAEVPNSKNGKTTVASMQYALVSTQPYKLTSDDVLFSVYAKRNNLKETSENRHIFFAKGQPCFRASPLTKRYGWGVHSDSKGKVALIGVNSSDYKNFSQDSSIKQLKAMRQRSAKKEI